MILKVVGAQSYKFTDDKTGRLVEGVNVFHLVNGDMNNGAVGLVPSKITLPLASFDKLSQFNYPIDCEVVTAQDFTRRGIVTKVVDLLPIVKG